MMPSIIRTGLSGVLALLLSVQVVVAGETAPGAMLYSNGTAWLNGGTVPRSAAVFAGDLVQTHTGSTANLNATGSNVMIVSDTLVKFQGSAVELERGGVRVATGRGLAAQAGQVTVKPATIGWTEYQVQHGDGIVQIAASKGALTITDDQGTTTLSPGQQTTRDDANNPEKKKKKRRAAPAAISGMSRAGLYAGLVLLGVVGTWEVLQPNDPASPVCPGGTCP